MDNITALKEDKIRIIFNYEHYESNTSFGALSNKVLTKRLNIFAKMLLEMKNIDKTVIEKNKQSSKQASRYCLFKRDSINSFDLV